jgi:hypothetical protein
VSSAWVYELAADLWGQWLPASTRETILRGGFYTVEVNSGLQAVVMNSMFCYNYNWYFFYFFFKFYCIIIIITIFFSPTF